MKAKEQSIEEIAKAEAEKRYQTTSMSNQIHRMNIEEDRKVFIDGFLAGYASKVGLQWVKASEGLPKEIWPQEIVFRNIKTKRVLDVHSYWTDTQLELNDADALGKPVGTLVLKSEIEWLDESSTANEGDAVELLKEYHEIANTKDGTNLKERYTEFHKKLDDFVQLFKGE